MINFIIIGIVLIIVSAVILYIRKEKKKGIKCVGCPYAKQCGSCGCNSENN